jgi:hypothetical protein
MSILTGYSGCMEDDILNMPEKELREAVIRAFSTESHLFAKDDSWLGSFILPDEVADAFRGRA